MKDELMEYTVIMQQSVYWKRYLLY